MISRIHRGFHRIGVVLVRPVILLVVTLADHEARLQWTVFADATPASKKPPNPFDLPSDAEPIPTAPAYYADYTMASLAFTLSLVLYAAVRAMG